MNFLYIFKNKNISSIQFLIWNGNVMNLQQLQPQQLQQPRPQLRQQQPLRKLRPLLLQQLLLRPLPQHRLLRRLHPQQNL